VKQVLSQNKKSKSKHGKFANPSFWGLGFGVDRVARLMKEKNELLPRSSSTFSIDESRMKRVAVLDPQIEAHPAVRFPDAEFQFARCLVSVPSQDAPLPLIYPRRNLDRDETFDYEFLCVPEFRFADQPFPQPNAQSGAVNEPQKTLAEWCGSGFLCRISHMRESGRRTAGLVDRYPLYRSMS
jgi:hypothetical protein